MSYYNGALLYARADDPSIENELNIRSNEFFWNKAIGPETSLMYVRDFHLVNIHSNIVQFSGHVSTRTFAPPTLAFSPQERVSSSEAVDFMFAQEYG